jgi:very-short-patch-repair endonuclease
MPPNDAVSPHARQLRLAEWVRARGGVAHSSDARAAGFTALDMSGAIRSEFLGRIRRSWLTTPDCDPRRIVAASVSGRVTCVSAAAMRGLWVPVGTADSIHVAVASTAGRVSSPGVRLHWGRGPAPVARNANDDPVLNVLFHLAHCLPRADALAAWESAVRLRLADPAVLVNVSWRSSRAQALAEVASALSDSGLETIVVDGLRRLGIVVRQQVWIDGRPVDGLIGSSLVVQVDGFEFHSRPADRRRDIQADARLHLRGYVVLRFDYHQILFEWEKVVDVIVTAIAQGADRRRVD